tara:strand:+ start:143142 stop:143696 length:555 start_codon:yes stop_codon:yes gene_type:complete
MGTSENAAADIVLNAVTYPELTEDEKSRLNLTMLQIVEEHNKARVSDLQQAQDLIKQALTITVYTFVAMSALKSIQVFIAFAGVSFIINNGLGALNKYKSRFETRLRAEVLKSWCTHGRYDKIQSFNGISRSVKIRDITFLEVLTSKKTIVFTYIAFVMAIIMASYFGLPSLLDTANVAVLKGN